VTAQVAHIDDLDRLPVAWGGVWRPVRRRFDVAAFGVNAWTADAAGDHVIELHGEADGPEELYVVLAGRATFTLADETVDAPAGSLVFVPPGTRREAVAGEDGTTVLAVGAKAGETFEPSPWEEWALADGLRRSGRIDEGRAHLRRTIDRYPDLWQPSYNAACLESIAGDADAALRHLRAAVDRAGDDARRAAREDPDFDPIKDDERFKELIA
jgi:quercetin dioxygenase-like cupin family protein